MASDAIESAGLKLASFSEYTISILRRKLSSVAMIANLTNPVDLTGSATPHNYEQALRVVIADPNVDGALVFLCPQGRVNVAQTAASIVTASLGCGKPVFTNFMGARDHRLELASLRMNGIPNYSSPETAVDGFKAMHHYRLWLHRRIEAPEVLEYDRNSVRATLHEAKQQGTKVLVGLDAMRILEACGFRLPKSALATDAAEAVGLAKEIGYPVVMKIVSPDIIHKTEFGAVRVGLDTAEAVRTSYLEIVESIYRHRPEARIIGVIVQAMAKGQEVILGMKRDPSSESPLCLD